MREIIVFGKGKYFAEKMSEIQKRYKIAAFIDNAVVSEGWDDLFQCQVCNPARLDCLPKHDILIVSSHFIDMWKQLKEIGVDDRRILFGNTLEPLQLGVETSAFGRGEMLTAADNKILYTTRSGHHFPFTSEEEFKDILRRVVAERENAIQLIAQLPLEPVSRVFGSERGKAVDRYYIEKFLEENSADITGSCMEIGTDMYMKRFGGDKVTESCILHVEGYGNALKGNFETGEGIREGMTDCLICTQTLQYIYDLHAAIRNIFAVLKPDGVALITVPGIKSLCLFDEDNWGEQWSFTGKSMERLCEELGDDAEFSVHTYGNAKIAAAYLYGVCREELEETDFEYNDRQFPFLITARIQKRTGTRG